MKEAKHKYQAYAAATQTVARTQQIVMLYDGIIRFMQQAREAVGQKRIETRYNMLSKASEIITGLQGCLDFEKGGDIARVLYSFYATIDSQIFSIHRSNSIETCDDVIDQVKKMRDVWQEIDHNNSSGNQKPAPQASSAPSVPPAEQNVTLSA